MWKLSSSRRTPGAEATAGGRVRGCVGGHVAVLAAPRRRRRVVRRFGRALVVRAVLVGVGGLGGVDGDEFPLAVEPAAPRAGGGWPSPGTGAARACRRASRGR